MTGTQVVLLSWVRSSLPQGADFYPKQGVNATLNIKPDTLYLAMFLLRLTVLNRDSSTPYIHPH